MKKIALVVILLLALVGCGKVASAASRAVLQDGDGNEIGTTANPLEVQFTGSQVVEDMSITNNLSVDNITFIGAKGAFRDATGGDLEFSEDSGATWSDVGGSAGEWSDDGTVLTTTDANRDVQMDKDVTITRNLSVGNVGNIGTLQEDGNDVYNSTETAQFTDLTITGNSDTQWLYNNGTDVFHKFSDGYLEISSSETNTVVQIGKNDALGSGTATLRLQDDSGAYLTEFIQDDGTLNIQAKTSAAFVVVNNDSDASNDFRVATGSQTHALFVDGGLNAVGINDSTPDAQLDVAGDLIVDLDVTVGNNVEIGGGLIVNTTTLVVNATTGRVGIGAAPSSILWVQDASNPNFIVRDSTNNCSAKVQALDTTVSIGTASNHNVNIVANDVIGITVNPDKTVTMAGDLIITGNTGAYLNLTLSANDTGIGAADEIEFITNYSQGGITFSDANNQVTLLENIEYELTVNVFGNFSGTTGRLQWQFYDVTNSKVLPNSASGTGRCDAMSSTVNLSASGPLKVIVTPTGGNIVVEVRCQVATAVNFASDDNTWWTVKRL